LAQWQALRARYQRPQPSPRQPANDTRAARQDFECSWNAWADDRIAAALNQHARMYDKAVGRALGRATAKLQDEIAELRCELDAARREIKRLKQKSAAPVTTVWHINRKLFTATPFDANGKAGPTINLHPLFEEYHVQTS
jgi:hypothetical protein